jgi:hypothetical protein
MLTARLCTSELVTDYNLKQAQEKVGLKGVAFLTNREMYGEVEGGATATPP